MGKGGGCLIAIVALVILGVIGAASNSGRSSPSRSVADYQQQQDMLLMTASQDAVRNRLRDPSSARFRGVRVNRTSVDGDDATVVCGEVNSRNGFGGYTGHQRFIAAAGTYVFLEEEVSDFDDAWQRLCI